MPSRLAQLRAQLRHEAHLLCQLRPGSSRAPRRQAEVERIKALITEHVALYGDDAARS